MYQTVCVVLVWERPQSPSTYRDGSSTPSLMEAKKVLEVAGCFLAITSTPVSIYSLLGFDARTVKTLQTELHQAPSPCATFGYEDLYKVFAGGSAIKILDRYDLHSVLHFFLMKLRTALDSAWMSNLPELRKVIYKYFTLLFNV